MRMYDRTSLVTVSEFATAKAFGRSSPKNSVTAVSVAVRNPREARGKSWDALDMNSAVLFGGKGWWRETDV